VPKRASIRAIRSVSARALLPRQAAQLDESLDLDPDRAAGELDEVVVGAEQQRLVQQLG
jgi:hypothetical protein